MSSSSAHDHASQLLLYIPEVAISSLLVGFDEGVSLSLYVFDSLPCVVSMLVVVVDISIENLSLFLMLSVVGGVSSEHSV